MMATFVLEVFATTESLVLDAAETLSDVVVSTILEDVAFSCSGAYAYHLQREYGGIGSAASFRPADVPLIRTLASETPELNSTRVLLMTRDAGGGGQPPGPSRRLLARASAKGTSGTGGSRPAVQTSKIDGQGWTTNDWAVAGDRKQGAVVIPRYVGLENVLLGGLFVHQVCSPSLPQVREAGLQASSTQLR